MSMIPIYTRIDDSDVRSFEKILSDSTEHELRVRINSYGGNYGSFGKISPILYRIAQKKVHIIGEAVHAESAALLLFLNCSFRTVETTSGGLIHLPEPNTENGMTEEIAEKAKFDAIQFIKRRTHLSEDTIVSLNNQPLSANDMVRLRIAHQKVFSFTPAEL